MRLKNLREVGAVSCVFGRRARETGLLSGRLQSSVSLVPRPRSSRERERAEEDAAGKPVATAGGGKTSEGMKSRRAWSAFREETNGA